MAASRAQLARIIYEIMFFTYTRIFFFFVFYAGGRGVFSFFLSVYFFYEFIIIFVVLFGPGSSVPPRAHNTTITIETPLLLLYLLQYNMRVFWRDVLRAPNFNVANYNKNNNARAQEQSGKKKK